MMEEQQNEENDENLPIALQNRIRYLQTVPVENSTTAHSWRMKERMKTVSVALVLCLNVGVDPPDFQKIDPCARLECWFDPSSVSTQKALELIGGNLQKQYERWQPRARYKQSLDPTVDDVKKLCTSLRRNAKEERVLFHYNGHGVPRPTQNGEIWVFNRNYTQYIPLSIYDLQTWMGAPSIYVYDCSFAGIIVNSFNTFAEQHELEQQANASTRSTPPTTTASNPSFKNCIQLAACGFDQILPMNPQLPADLFTSCLTTPIKTALKWFTLQSTNKLVPNVSYDMIESIPGILNDRRTMLGELNWIFTAITDTIAWNTLPKDLFQKLFRQDLLVASLFRNFLLADRILRSYDCTPISVPALPQTYRHPMWDAWDLALDLALSQLPDILESKKSFEYSPFFEEQLTAFQVWLDGNPQQKSPPEQLPIVLQVLLSQVHRLRALELLGRFLDIGPWAVNLALSVGIFPYVLKLLQSPAVELRPCLVFIWAKILAVDSACQVDLVKEGVDTYFLAALADTTTIFNHDCRTFAAFVLASIVYKFEQGQANAMKGSLVSICLEQINDENPLLRKWFAICLGNLWHNFDNARWSGARDLAQEKLYILLKDPRPEVRAAAVYALGTFISSTIERTAQANDLDRSIGMTLLSTVGNDMSPLVRMELVAALQWIVKLFDSQFVEVFLREDPQFHSNNNHALTTNSNNSSLTRVSSRFHNNSVGMTSMKSVSSCSSIVTMGTGNSLGNVQPISYSSIYSKLWHGMMALAKDPYVEVAQVGNKVIEYIRNQAIELIQAKEAFTEKLSSCSLPPSPNTRTNYLESPTPSPSSYQYMSHHLNKDTLNVNLLRISEGSPQPQANQTTKPHKLRIPIIRTNFIDCEVSSFARPSKFLGRDGKFVADQHSLEAQQRNKRFVRNSAIRKEGKEQTRKAAFNRLDGQFPIGKTRYTSTIVQLHPYSQQAVVAYRDLVMLNDFDKATVTTLTPPVLPQATIQTTTNKRSTTNVGRVTSIQFINAHDRGMILSGYDDGVIRIWKNTNHANMINNTVKKSGIENNLVTAFQALDDIVSRSSKLYGLLTAWHQQSETIIVGGESKILRLWDADKELKILDIQTGSEFVVSHISCAPNGIFSVGFGDGSIRIYDRRCYPNENKVITYREFCVPLLTVNMRNDCNSLVTGCTNGEVRVFDLRMKSSVHNWPSGNDITTMAAHSTADIVACAGSFIAIHGLDGRLINTIRCHEGFMGSKIGQTSCLAFHPHKVSLVAGFVDNTVSLFMPVVSE